MIKSSSDKLLQDERVVAEINKHKWFESEKAGHDIGFEQASRDWMNRFGSEWARKHGYESAETAQMRPQQQAESATRGSKKKIR